MAYGVPPKFSETYDITGVSPEQFIVIAIEAALSLGWEIMYKSETGLVAHTRYSEARWSEEFTITAENGKAFIKSICRDTHIMDMGRNERNVSDFLEKFGQLKSKYSPEEIGAKFNELKQGFISKDSSVFGTAPASKEKKFSGVLSIFKPVQGYFITPILIDINILVFLLMVISGVSAILPDNDSLLAWGANFRPMTLAGQWWRLLTCCFLHIGILHLLMNMYALVYIGVLLEPILGKAKFLAAYLLTGIASSVASLYWHDLTISAGASGAIFGMYGVFLSLLTSNVVDKSARKALLSSTVIFVGYNLMYGMKGGVDNAAHIGGLVSGVIMGYAFYPSLMKPEEKSIHRVTIALLAGFVLLGSYYVYGHTTNDIGKYDEYMEKFASNEKLALRVYHLPDGTPKDTVMHALDVGGIKLWNENLKILSETDQLNIPDLLKERDDKLKTYCRLRISSYEFLKRNIFNDDGFNKDSLNYYNNKIKAIIDLLNPDKKSQ